MMWRGRSRAIRTMSAKGATAERPGVSNDLFNMIYSVLLGEERGPRFGSFMALYGVDKTRALIDKALRGVLVRESQIGPRAAIASAAARAEEAERR